MPRGRLGGAVALGAGLAAALLLPAAAAPQSAGPLQGALAAHGIVAAADGRGLGTWEAFEYAAFAPWPRRLRIHWTSGRVMDMVPERVETGPLGSIVHLGFREFEVPGPVQDTPSERWTEVSAGDFVLMDPSAQHPGWDARYAVTTIGAEGPGRRRRTKLVWIWVHLLELQNGSVTDLLAAAPGQRLATPP